VNSLKLNLKKAYNKASSWFREHNEWEHRLFAVIIVIGITALLAEIFFRVRYDVLCIGDNHLYLLSSIVQGLAAILALLVTLSLVAGQLAANAYTPRVMSHRLKDFWLWFAVSIYLLAIVWSLWTLNTYYCWKPNCDWLYPDIAFTLACMALAYLIPYTIATIRSLQPDRIARQLVKKEE